MSGDISDTDLIDILGELRGGLASDRPYNPLLPAPSELALE